jgi:hypothetical protein
VVGIFFVGFAVLWMGILLGMGLLTASGGREGAIAVGMPLLCFGLIGVPFLVLGILLLMSPSWQKKMARKCCFVLTDRRALTWEPSWRGVTVRSYTRAGLGRITRIENADGSGSLVFQEYTVHQGQVSGTQQQGFLHIADVRLVDQLVRKVLLKEGPA